MLLAGCLLCLLSVPAAAGLSPGERTLCHLVSGVRSLTFLARLGGDGGGGGGGGPGRLVLFHTLWSGRDLELEQCTVQPEPSITRNYLAFCLQRRQRPGLEEKEGRFLRVGEPEPRLRILQQVAAARCRLTTGPGSPRRRERAAGRDRRSWTVPGTIWCGAGDSAEKFSDLGRFNQTDFCCREHDHCEHKIAAFEYNYGILNFRLHTVSHCDCDDRFKKCLLGVNNTISKVVGLTFFNLLKVPCFILEPVKHCVKRSGLSRCHVTVDVPKAIFHPQSTFYDTQPPAGGAGVASGPTPTGSPMTTTRVNQNASGVSRGFVYPSSRLDTAQGARIMNKKKCKKCGGHQKQGTEAPSQDILKWRAGNFSIQTDKKLPPEAKVARIPGMIAGGSGSPGTCNCCRPLDRCEHKILPWEFKFSHYNQGPKTLYHCNCTRRLAKRMKGRVNVNRLKELFFKFVSLNCFQLKNCNQEELVGCENRSSSPMAVLFKPRYLQRFLKVQRTAEESLSPLPDEHEGNQNSTFNSTNSVKLYDKCLQMIRALTVKP